jgi:hypothetical protein
VAAYLHRMKGLIFILSLFLSGILCAQDSLRLPLLGREVKVYFSGVPQSPVLLYNMHDNENTAATAGRIVSKEYGGEYFELMHEGKRLISFQYGNDSVHIDPNRIYTDAGIWAQLKKNKLTDTLAFQAIQSWRNSLLAILDIAHRQLVIALHNNTNKDYGFKSYGPGEEFENEAAALRKGSVHDQDDFYFVTDPRIMYQLEPGRYNIILQSNTTMTDDGSLSVYCAQLGIPYVNVETQHNRLLRQMKMLIYAYQQLVR